MARFYQVPRSYNVSKARKSRARRGSCHCPSGAKMLSTRGRGRGFVCQSGTPKTFNRRGRRYKIRKPFVRAVGC
jgi:hypothetical protein